MNSNSHINHGIAVYIINSAGIVYHQHGVLYLIKPQIGCALTRDDMLAKGAMIYQACGLDKTKGSTEVLPFVWLVWSI